MWFLVFVFLSTLHIVFLFMHFSHHVFCTFGLFKQSYNNFQWFQFSTFDVLNLLAISVFNFRHVIIYIYIYIYIYMHCGFLFLCSCFHFSHCAFVFIEICILFLCRNPTLAKCGGEAQHFQSWGFGVPRDSRMFRAWQKGPKHLALKCPWCHWKGLEA